MRVSITPTVFNMDTFNSKNELKMMMNELKKDQKIIEKNLDCDSPDSMGSLRMRIPSLKESQDDRRSLKSDLFLERKNNKKKSSFHRESVNLDDREDSDNSKYGYRKQTTAINIPLFSEIGISKKEGVNRSIIAEFP